MKVSLITQHHLSQLEGINISNLFSKCLEVWYRMNINQLIFLGIMLGKIKIKSYKPFYAMTFWF